MPEDLSQPLPPNAQPMTRVDYAWLRMDRPSNLMTITGLLFFDDPLELEDLRRVIAERLGSIPRFRQRVVHRRFGASWVEHEDFDVAEHVAPIELPEPRDRQALEERVGELMSKPLDPTKPLWRFDLIENYAEGGSVVVGRLHHCIGDGVALMMVLLSLTDLESEPAESADENPLVALFHKGAEAVEAAVERAREIMPQTMKLVFHASSNSSGKKRSRSKLVLGLSKALGRVTFLPSDPKTVFKGALGGGKAATWSDAISVDEVRAVGAAIGGTINDVLLTAMTGGLRHYLMERNHPVEGLDFRAAMPVNLRPPHKLADLGNQFGLVFLPLPVGIGDPLERLAEFRRRAEALKGSLEAGAVYGIIHGMGLAPHAIQKLLVRMFDVKATAVMTNVPGPQEPLYVAGKPLKDILFWVPQTGRVGLGISILSYAGRVRLGVTTDTGLVPDPRVIVEGFHREFDRLVEIASSRQDV